MEAILLAGTVGMDSIELEAVLENCITRNLQILDLMT
jgi:hypothetical protein